MKNVYALISGSAWQIVFNKRDALKAARAASHNHNVIGIRQMTLKAYNAHGRRFDYPTFVALSTSVARVMNGKVYESKHWHAHPDPTK